MPMPQKMDFKFYGNTHTSNFDHKYYKKYCMDSYGNYINMTYKISVIQLYIITSWASVGFGNKIQNYDISLILLAKIVSTCTSVVTRDVTCITTHIMEKLSLYGHKILPYKYQKI